MFRTSAQRLQRTATGALKRAYTSQTEKPSTAHKLAEELLAQKTSNVKGKATLPKGDKKPIKAKGEKGNSMKQVAMVSGGLTGLGIGSLFYYGKLETIICVYIRLFILSFFSFFKKKDVHSTMVEKTK